MGAGATVNGGQSQPKFITANGEVDANDTPFVPSLFSVSLLEDCSERLSPVFRLPKTFQLRVAEESLDFIAEVEGEVKLYAQFPYQTIAAWGSNSQAFKISIFDHTHSSVSTKGEIAILLKTFRGRAIEDTVVQAVRRLMNAMELYNLKKKEHDQLLMDIIDTDTKGLVEGWRQVIESCAGDKFLSSKQSMDLMATVALHSTPFEQTELACLLYSKILHRDSFQLVVNMFQDLRDRENLVHLLSQQDRLLPNVGKPINDKTTDGKRGPKKKYPPFQSDCFMFKHVIVADHISSGPSSNNNDNPNYLSSDPTENHTRNEEHKPSINEFTEHHHTSTDISQFASNTTPSSLPSRLSDIGMKEIPS